MTFNDLYVYFRFLNILSLFLNAYFTLFIFYHFVGISLARYQSIVFFQRVNTMYSPFHFHLLESRVLHSTAESLYFLVFPSDMMGLSLAKGV